MKVETQDIPLNDSPNMPHFWERTLRKLLPASSVATGHDSSHQWSMLRKYNLLKEVSNWLGFWLIKLEGVLCKRIPVKSLFLLTTSEMNHASVKCWTEPGGDSPCSSHLERKLQEEFLPPDNWEFTTKIKQENTWEVTALLKMRIFTTRICVTELGGLHR